MTLSIELENTDSKASFRGQMTINLGPNQSEVFVSHRGDNIQQAVVYMDLELCGEARLRDIVMSVISIDTEVKTTGQQT